MRALRMRRWLLDAALLLALGVALPVRAIEYEVFVEIEEEDDIYDLFQEHVIDQDAFNQLIELYRTGVDLNTADRNQLYSLPNLTYADVDAILAYRKEAGRIVDPASLVAAGVLDAHKLLAIASFLRETDAAPQAPYATRGRLRLTTTWLAGEPNLPGAALLGRLKSFRNFELGFASVFTRHRLNTVDFDPSRGALTAPLPAPQVQIPKFYGQWTATHYGLIVGTYRIGFGEGLTFDTTGLNRPDGFRSDLVLRRDIDLSLGCRLSTGELAETPCPTDGRVPIAYVSPDFKWTDGLRGIAASARGLPLGGGTWNAHLFGSWQTHSIYQYQVYDTSECSDPRDCSAPPVYVELDDPTEPAPRHAYQTLPGLFDEYLGGGHLGYEFDGRTSIGVTGYGASVHWLRPEIPLDFQNWARRPYGGPYGAVGIDGTFGLGSVDFFGEVARSFDSMFDGGGGFGGQLRGVVTLGRHRELEVSARYLDTAYANPFSRALSEADLYDGLRARDEAGGRIRYSGVHLDRHLTVRSAVDLWTSLSDGILKGLAYARADLEVSDHWTVGLWLDWGDKDLSRSGRGQCYEGDSSEENPLTGEPLPCAGEKYRALGRLRLQGGSRWWVTLQYQHEFVDDRAYPDHMRQDVSGWLIGVVKPLDGLTVRGRARYTFEDIEDNTRREQLLATTLETTWRATDALRLRLRYDFLVWLDERERTQYRSPSPAHWLWFEVETRF
ncbi:MAG: hypothetical protein D6729_08995 [Deltaproteobacteria bacterium]|nr:MAG: hypothetical protein D6729_08995 [Deltaproteobacteria bacterium]